MVEWEGMEQTEAVRSVDFIQTAEPKLLEWTYQAVKGFALYSGANQSLKERLCPTGDASQLADRYREPAALITATRLYALFDRSAEVSFQVVKQHMANPVVQDLLVSNYAHRGSFYPAHLERECRDCIAKFLSDYATLNVAAFKRLHHFRNLGLAHVTLQEVNRSITYQEMEDMVRLAASLAHNLSLASRSQSTLLQTEPDSETARIRDEWLACIKRDASLPRSD
jgi:hypothetical protein